LTTVKSLRKLSTKKINLYFDLFLFRIFTRGVKQILLLKLYVKNTIENKDKKWCILHHEMSTESQKINFPLRVFLCKPSHTSCILCIYAFVMHLTLSAKAILFTSSQSQRLHMTLIKKYHEWPQGFEKTTYHCAPIEALTLQK
jgi:hypothetical protein